MRFLARLVCLTVLFGSAAAAAETVPILRVSGTLSDSSGKPLFGSYLLLFRIFDAAGREQPVWSESRYVKAEGGRFSAVLGRVLRLPDGVLSGPYRLEAQPPAGTGWKAAVFGSMDAGADRPSAFSQGVPEPDAAQARQGAPPESMGEAAGDVRRLERALEGAREEAARARRETEESRRRLDALERGVSEPPAPAVPSGPRIYVVQAGDTLRSVALKTLGDERHWIAVYQANDDRIQRAGELAAGQKLLIPALAR